MPTFNCMNEGALSRQAPLLYLKPVQTGFPADSDARLVVLPLSRGLIVPQAEWQSSSFRICIAAASVYNLSVPDTATCACSKAVCCRPLSMHASPAECHVNS